MRTVPAPRHPVRALALSLLAAAGLIACGGDDSPSSNAPPTIELTAGPMDGDSAAWSASFHWLGTDPDGYVDHYEYALDVPAGEVGGIGTDPRPDIPWTRTTALEGRFPFGTPDPDSLHGNDGQPGPPSRWTGQHTFVIRAVDDGGAYSVVEYVEFTALNYAPRTRVEPPPPAEWVWSSHCPPSIRWHSIDPDAAPGTSGIAGYEVKYKNLASLPIPIRPFTPADLLSFMDDAPWVPVPADSPSFTPAVGNQSLHLMAIRARDGAGAVESVFMGNENILMAYSAGLTGLPELSVREPILGPATFPGPEWNATVGVGTPLQFEMNGDAADFGGVITGYNHGIDVDPDSDPEGPGWSGWTTDRTTGRIVFDAAGLHQITFMTRANGVCPNDSRTTGILVLRVIDMPMDHDVLYVDDFRRSVTQGFRDADQDARNEAMLAAAGVAVDDPMRFQRHDAWGTDDVFSDPAPLTLEDLARFRLVYWDVLGSGLARNPLLISASRCPGRVLPAYVAAGGGLWVAGQSVMGAFDVAAGAICLANMGYELGSGGSIDFGADDFPCVFMNLCGGGFTTVRTSPTHARFVSAEPTPDALAGGFPQLTIDSGLLPNTSTLGFTDFMLMPTFEASGGLDSLYVHSASSPTSAADGKPNAFRYRDPDPVPSQGPVAVFAFPLFFLNQGSTGSGTGTFGAARLMLDWFRAEQQRFHDTRPQAVAGRGR
jgi:hypothetical protein